LSILRRILAPASATVLLLALPARPWAHEIPATVTVHAFVKPEGQRLRLLVRAPLAAMRDIQFPVRDRGYLELGGVDTLLAEAARLWIAGYIQLFEGGAPLGDARIVATRVSLPSDRAFGRYDEAVAHVTGAPLPAEAELVPAQALLDVLLEYSITSESSPFAVRPEWAHLGMRTTTVLRFLPPGGAERVFQYAGDPGMVRLDPRWHQAALQFVKLGFMHILDGIDHLLFVLCLIIPFRRIRPLIVLVTSFTVAHSITLIASAFGLAPTALWFAPLIETLIALSILYMALENIVGAHLERRWLFAFGFGLVHGFGFSFLLRDSLQFAGSHLITSLLAFNIGVELGQLFVLLLAIPLLHLLFARVVSERMGTILLSALVAHTAWHWTVERANTLRQYPMQWPVFDLFMLAAVLRWLMLLLILGGTVWLLFGLFGRVLRNAPVEPVSGRLEGS
jgi:hypothetical protein